MGDGKKAAKSGDAVWFTVPVQVLVAMRDGRTPTPEDAERAVQERIDAIGSDLEGEYDTALLDSTIQSCVQKGRF